MPYLSALAVVIHYEEALYQVYAPLPLCIFSGPGQTWSDLRKNRQVKQEPKALV